MSRRRTPTAEQEGSASVELAVLTPVLLVVLAVAVAAGRIVTAEAAVDQAATAAARAASLARTPAEAQTTAASTGGQMLTQQGMSCAEHAVGVDTSGLTTSAGQAGQVTAHVTCTVTLASLLVPGLPGRKTLSESFTSPVDPFRTKA
jgi:Flp pilus assembly protein TadG